VGDDCFVNRPLSFDGEGDEGAAPIARIRQTFDKPQGLDPIDPVGYRARSSMRSIAA
jgi:hypothetical protein